MDPTAVRVDGRREAGRVVSRGQLLLFEGRVEPLAQRTFYVYFRRGSGQPRARSPIVRQYAANPAMPGGQSQEAVHDVAAGRLSAVAQKLRQSDQESPISRSGDKLPEHWSGGAEGQRIAGVKMGFDGRGFSARAAWK